MKHHHHQPTTHGAKWVFIGFALIAGYFLVTEHTAHLRGWLASYGIWLLLLACPLLHFFMHGTHGGHGSSDHGNAGDGPTEGEQRREQTK